MTRHSNRKQANREYADLQDIGVAEASRPPEPYLNLFGVDGELPDELGGGYGPGSYFAHAMAKDD